MKIIKHIVICVIFAIMGSILYIPYLKAQIPELFIVIHEEEVHIYHLHLIPIGHGFNIYRKDPGETDYKLLNEEVVKGAQRGDELPSYLGENYHEIRKRLEQPNALTSFYKLRSSPFLNELFTMVYPKVARALGRVYVDTYAPIGERVAYKIEIIDNNNEPTGKTLTRTVMLHPKMPSPPTRLSAEHRGRRVNLAWYYPQSPLPDPDNIVRFNLYRINRDTEEFTLLNDDIILRDNSIDRFSFEFTARSVEITEHYMVTAVDITGRESEPSDVISYEVTDNVLPSRMYNLRARWLEDGTVELTWPVSFEPRVAGYHIYRSIDISDGYVRINKELIELLETVYVDAEVVGGRDYFYRITAVSHVGNEGEKSNAVGVFVYDFEPPRAPFNVEARYDIETNSVLLHWEVERIPSDFETFIILRRSETRDAGRAFSRVTFDNIKSTEVTDRGIAEAGFIEGEIYLYAVYAVDRAGNESDTAYTHVHIPKLTPPLPPREVVAVNENGHRIRVYWNPSLSTDVVQYNLYRKQRHDPEYEVIARTPNDQRTVRDESVFVGNTYIYAVCAVDDAGNESSFSEPDTLNFRDFTPLRSIRNLQGIERDEGVYLKWQEVITSDLAGYRVYRSDLPNGVFKAVNVELITDAEFFDPDGTSIHWYRVCAVDSSGNESRPGRPVRPTANNR